MKFLRQFVTGAPLYIKEPGRRDVVLWRLLQMLTVFGLWGASVGNWVFVGNSFEWLPALALLPAFFVLWLALALPIVLIGRWWASRGQSVLRIAAGSLMIGASILYAGTLVHLAGAAGLFSSTCAHLVSFGWVKEPPWLVNVHLGILIGLPLAFALLNVPFARLLGSKAGSDRENTPEASHAVSGSCTTGCTS